MPLVFLLLSEEEELFPEVSKLFFPRVEGRFFVHGSSMSFPASFRSQLAAVLEALTKAVVAEVTALVEDGAVELRLELSEKDREILELRAALELLEGELLKTREAAASPGREDKEEPAESSQVYGKGERKSFVFTILSRFYKCNRPKVR